MVLVGKQMGKNIAKEITGISVCTNVCVWYIWENLGGRKNEFSECVTFICAIWHFFFLVLILHWRMILMAREFWFHLTVVDYTEWIIITGMIIPWWLLIHENFHMFRFCSPFFTPQHRHFSRYDYWMLTMTFLVLLLLSFWLINSRQISSRQISRQNDFTYFDLMNAY